MTKQEFLRRLRKGIKTLPQNEIDERITFYSEMIDDRIEEGFSEADAVNSVGSVDTIISQIISEVPSAKKEKTVQKRKMKAWEIVLLVLGSPIWFSLAVAVISVIFSLYGALWAVIISLWAVFISFVASSLACIVAGIVGIVLGNYLIGGTVLGAGVALAGLSILTFFVSFAATKIILILAQKTAIGIKNAFTKKEI